ncbi:MAG: hypothetical protein ACON4K_07525 [Akkermansiaceae bacterium]
MESSKLLTISLTSAVVIIGSIFLGTAAGTQDLTTTGGFIVAIVAIAAFFGLGKRVWILIPTFAAWSGKITLLPIPFSVANIVIGFAVFTMLTQVAANKVRLNYKPDGLDIWILLLAAILAAGFFRNPVGLASFTGGAMVGARPYVEILIGVAGYLFLSTFSADAKSCQKLPVYIIGTSMLLALGGIIAFFIPSAGFVLYNFYSDFSPNFSELRNPYENSDSVGRAAFVRPLAYSLAAWAVASKSPIKLVLPLPFKHSMALYFAALAALISGFRSSILQIAFTFLIGCWIWLRGIGLIGSIAVGLLVISSAIIIQDFYPLPERIQRSLSMLPGNWSQKVILDAEGSTEWRLEMWKVILEGDSVKNQWIGDGFGFPRAELEYYGALQASGQLPPEQLAEYFLMTGGVHSGPLSALKFVGWLGLGVFIFFSVMVSLRYAKLWRVAREQKGITDPLAIAIGFFALLAIYFPIKYVAIYGAFDVDAPRILVLAGMLRLFEKVVEKEKLLSEVK